MRRGRFLALIAVAVGALWFFSGWYSGGPLAKDTAFVVPDGASLGVVADKLAANGAISSASAFKLRARLLGGGGAIKAGEVLLPKAASPARILGILRGADTVARTPQEALTLASIVEKETGKPSERPMVAGLYSNRVRQGMMLQADPTIIYPITAGKPLGRRIKQSEIAAVNDYNTYAMVGLPKGPITNPGKKAIEAVLHPAKTEALYMVADGTGGHQFAATLAEHNANVAKWFALRRARGEL